MVKMIMSVLEPLMWHIRYDGVLRLQLSVGCSILTSADDIAIVCVVKNVGEELEEKVNITIRMIRAWLSRKILDIKEFVVSDSTKESKRTIR